MSSRQRTRSSACTRRLTLPLTLPLILTLPLPLTLTRRVYETCGRAAVAELLNGQSGCVLVYGQTGSGKTFTMFGEAEADPRLPHEKRGLVPRVCEELLAAAEARRATAGIDTVLSVSYVEVFGSEVTDLLLTMTPYYLLLTMALATIYPYTYRPTYFSTTPGDRPAARGCTYRLRGGGASGQLLPRPPVGPRGPCRRPHRFGSSCRRAHRPR